MKERKKDEIVYLFGEHRHRVSVEGSVRARIAGDQDDRLRDAGPERETSGILQSSEHVAANSG